MRVHGEFVNFHKNGSARAVFVSSHPHRVTIDVDDSPTHTRRPPASTIAKIMRPRGVRAVVPESLLLKHQLVISSRARRRAPNLNSFDRFVFALGSLFIPASRHPKLAGILPTTHTVLACYAWRHHCRGLFQTPIAA
jgi:hypothetical protein